MKALGFARRRSVGEAALFFCAYLAASELGYALSLGTAVGGTFWPPSGLTLGVLLYAARTAWPRLVVAGLVANFTSDQLHGMSVPASLGFAAANLVEPYVAAYLLRRRAGKEIRLNRAADFIALGLVECFIAAPLASLIGALTVELWAATSPGFAMTFRTWWVGNAVGGLVLAPVVLRALLDFRRAREVPILRWAEAAAFMAVVVAITHAVFSGSSKLLLGPILVFPLLLWGSIRMGPVGVGVAAFLMVLVANHDTAANVGPFASPDLPVQSRIIALQLYAAVAVTSFQILALAWEERVDRDILHEANVTLQRREEQLQEALLAVQQAQARAEALADAERVARSQVERVSRVKDEFLATLSHELRTPLNAALGWAQILLQQDLQDGSVKRGVTVIERNTRAQARLIDDLLEMSRINSGKLRLELETVSLRELVGTVVESFRPSAEARKLRLSLEVRPPSDTFPARVDVGRLQQVVSNIVGNAIKFTPDGGSVALVLRREAAQIELAVSDTGRGIPSEFLPQVFDRFRQADGSTTRRHGGLGLGMSIASRLTEMHGGSLVAVSEGEGRGATFTLSLPAATDAIAKPAASATTGSPLDGRQLLVVDDDSDALEMMDRLLAGQGCSVERAASAKEALARLSDVRPDVLLSDISMPEMDGYELMREVRKRPELVAMKAVAVTAFARPEDRQRALDAGFDAHVAKPVDLPALLRVFERLAVK